MVYTIQYAAQIYNNQNTGQMNSAGPITFWGETENWLKVFLKKNTARVRVDTQEKEKKKKMGKQ